MGIRAEFLRSALASGQPVRPTTTSLVLDAGGWLTGRGPEDWEAHDLMALAWYGVVAWCRWAGVDVPADAAETVRCLAGHLDPDGRLGFVEAVVEVVDPVAPSARHRPSRAG